MSEIEDMILNAMSLSKDERLYLCDTGVFNGVIRGYLIEAMKNAGFNQEEILRASNGLSVALDETTAAEAAEIDRKF